jgi:SAM-dependent methyltransferase
MNDRSHGYDTSVGYSFGFYREMAPDWLDLCLRAAGHAPARVGSSYRYLELGCGQGFGLCLLAAANPESEFVGVDFQRDHIDHALQLARSGSLGNIRFIQADFFDLAQVWPEDIGTFDYVALHGILTWVSPKLREAVSQCLAGATHEGSLVYASYNAQPSWLGTMPFQHITRLLKDASLDPSEAVIERSITLFEKLRAGSAPVFNVLPALGARLQTLRSHSVNYLVHEYLNETWEPLWHSEVARTFEPAGLRFAGSATIADNLLPDVLSEKMRATILEQGSSELREDVQDIAINQGFRRDIFCRGLPKGLTETLAENSRRFILLSRPEAGKDLVAQTSFGPIALQWEHVGPIANALDAGPRTFGELADESALAPVDLRQLLILLLHADMIAIEAAPDARIDAAHRLNAAIANAAANRAPYEQLAAARLGSAIRVSQIELLLLDAWLALRDQGNVDELATGVWERMSALGHKLYHLGEQVDDASARQQLREVAVTFIEDVLPRWRQLGVVS